MVCKKCNRELSGNDKFCVYCGNKIEKEVAATPFVSVAPVAEPLQKTVVPTPLLQPVTKVVTTSSVSQNFEENTKFKILAIVSGVVIFILVVVIVVLLASGKDDDSKKPDKNDGNNIVSSVDDNERDDDDNSSASTLDVTEESEENKGSFVNSTSQYQNENSSVVQRPTTGNNSGVVNNGTVNSGTNKPITTQSVQSRPTQPSTTRSNQQATLRPVQPSVTRPTQRPTQAITQYTTERTTRDYGDFDIDESVEPNFGIEVGNTECCTEMDDVAWGTIETAPSIRY